MKRVLAFGSFDALHPGHMYFIQEAAKLGDHLTIVVARDEYLKKIKKRKIFTAQTERMKSVRDLNIASEVILGDAPGSYTLTATLPFDILAVGYDQEPSDEEIKALLKKVKTTPVEVQRLPAFKPEIYKSSLLRASKKPT